MHSCLLNLYFSKRIFHHYNRFFTISTRLISSNANSQIRHKSMNYYDILRISPNANASQIKTAYYKLSLIYHPDRNQGSSEFKNKFAAVCEAYEVLSDKEKRFAYDKTLSRPLPRFNQHFRKDVLQYHKKRNLKYAYDYDEWTRAHYGDAFRRSQRRSQDQMDLFRALRTANHKNVVLNRAIQITTLLVALVCILAVKL